jgi:hypothetical protein
MLGVGLMPWPMRAQQNTHELAVGVQTRLDRQKLIWDGVHAHKLENAPEHGKIYAILVIQPTASLRKLVKPVKAADIRDELVNQLETHGYHHVQPGQKPEILLWVIYGRSWMPNPYFRDNINVDNMGPENDVPDRDYDNPGSMPSAPQGVVIENPNLAAELSIPRNSHAATKLSLEKLFILVRAFKYPPPPDPKKKPEALWVATMYVDDPAHRDLNLVFKQMLEAGAPYFDQEIKGQEVEILKNIPEGHVNVGTPEVVTPAKALEK